MVRTEFNIVVDRCGCFQAMQGNCHPKKCFPEMYKLAYPKGGMNIKSHLTQRVTPTTSKETRNG